MARSAANERVDQSEVFQQYEAPPEPNFRQQDKLVAALERGDKKIFSTHEVPLRSGEKQNFYMRLAKDEVDPSDVVECLMRIRPNFANRTTHEIFQDVEDYPNLKQIKGMVAVALTPELINDNKVNLKAFQNRDRIGPNDLGRLFEQYPEPATLESKLQVLLKEVRDMNGNDKYEEYQTSLRVMLRVMYGKREEYWEQYKLMMEEAKQRYGNGRRSRTEHGQNEQQAEQVNPEGRKAPEKEKPLEVENEGSIPRSYKESAAGDMSGKKRRELDEQDGQRVAPILQMMASRQKIPLTFETDDTIQLRSIPERPNITDQEAEQLIRSFGRELRTAFPGAQSREMSRRLIAVFMPNNFAKKEYGNIESPDAFATKNSIYRVLLTHMSDSSYFEHL